MMMHCFLFRRHSAGVENKISSCPGLTRVSTPIRLTIARSKRVLPDRVDGRVKPGHDEGE